jgi:PBSX family phage terminase large subunit
MSWWNKNSSVSDRFGIIIDGAVRSGKTLPGSCSYVLWSFDRFPQGGKSFFIAGKSIGTVRRNVIKPLVQAGRYLGLAIQERRSDSMLVVTNGAGYTNSFYIFGGNDESSKDLIQGFTGSGGFFDEVTLLPRSFVDQALSRLSVKGATAWFTCNPDSPSHWFKKEFIDVASDKDLLYLHLTMDDNLSLDEDVRARYKSLFSGVFYRRNILGEWCLADGLVYSSFDAGKMIVPTRSLEDYSELIIGSDYGVQNPMVYLLLGYSHERNRWEVAREYYHDGRKDGQKTDAQYYADLVEFAGGTTAQNIAIDPSAASLIAAIREGRRFRVTQADNRVIPGIQFVSSLLQGGRLVVCDECVNTIREMQTYSWDVKASEKQGRDIVLKESDHALDALRYACMTYIRRYARRYGIAYVDLIDKEAT